MSRHFCCCIPVRVAVFFFSLLSFLGAGFSAAVGWFIVYAVENDKLDKLEKDMDPQDKQTFELFLQKYKTGFIVASVIFTLIALMSFFGFIGSIIRNRRMVKAYSYMTIFIFVLGSAASGFMLFLVWKRSPFCVTVNGVETCAVYNLTTGQKVGYTVWAVIEWLIQLYIVVIIHRYYKQLQDEHDNKYYDPAYRLTPTANGTYEAKQGLLHNNQGYAFADNDHSFGKQGHV